MVYVHIVLFLLFQVIANVFLKWGSLADKNYWWGFALGNIVAVISLIFMMGMYKHLSPAMTLAVGQGGTFILVQTTMMLFFKQPFSWGTAAGIAIIAGGIVLIGFSNAAAAASAN